MTPMGLVEPVVPVLELPTKTVTEPQLRFEDGLASANRLWVRGQLSIPPATVAQTNKSGNWWEWWRPEREVAPSAPTVNLETRISGQVFKTDIPLGADGRFEAMFDASLPAARRGWRIARHRVSWANETAEKCSVVLRPTENARGAVVVLLPRSLTSEPHGAQRLAHSELATRLTPMLRRLQQEPGGTHAFYYLACVRAGGNGHQAELALATTTLGWPNGNFILLPTEPHTVVGTVAEGLDRLRWLFAGSLELLVINLEPALTEELAPLLQAKNDRAPARLLLNPDDDPNGLVGGLVLERARTPRSSLRSLRAGLVPRYPVVFCHGMLAFSTIRRELRPDWNSFSPLREFLRERGFQALFPRVAPTSGVVARARQLREQINRWTDEPINIIAHSMGGLDARYMITHLGMADRVRSLTTIATPHRGTHLVDWYLANPRQRFLLLALQALGVNVDGFKDCRPTACREFNASTPDMPGVRYFSMGGEVAAKNVVAPLRRASAVLAALEGPNDGMVSVASARWGEYLGTLHADHFVQTPDLAFPCPGQSFNALGFYVRLLEDLARRDL